MDPHDTIVRQVEHLARVLARVLFHTDAGHPERVEASLTEGIAAVLGVELDALRELSRDALLAACGGGSGLASEQAVAVADLLSQDVTDAGRERARWLYEAALASGGAVPLDIYDRIEAAQGGAARNNPNRSSDDAAV